MILGVLSDTHGNLPRTKAALNALREHSAEHIIHCGDIGSEGVIDLLFEQQEEGIPVTAVMGNVDEWDPWISVYAEKLEMPLSRTARLSLGGVLVAVCHGHHPSEMGALLNDPALEVLFTGHTHVPMDEMSGSVRVLNPGAIHRSPVPGYACFDTESRIWNRYQLENP